MARTLPLHRLAQTPRGPWFSTQLTLSLTVGLASFLLFCWLRRYERFKVLYKPRTLLKGAHPRVSPPRDLLAVPEQNVLIISVAGRFLAARSARPRLVLRMDTPDPQDVRVRRPAARRIGCRSGACEIS